MDFNPYYNNKTIQRSFFYKFSIIDGELGVYLPNNESMPEIQEFNCISVSLPHYTWKKEIQYYGVFPRSTPVLTFDGHEIQVTLEDDDSNTVLKLIQWLQRRIIHEDGVYHPPALNRLTEIRVDIMDELGNTVTSVSYPKAYFLKADNIDMSYESSNAMRYAITFGSDFQEFESGTVNGAVDSDPKPSQQGSLVPTNFDDPNLKRGYKAVTERRGASLNFKRDDLGNIG